MESKRNNTGQSRPRARSCDGWELRLYIAGGGLKSLEAFTNLKKICDEHLAGKCRIEVIDLLKTPQLARGDQILAMPTLVRTLPKPIKKIMGDLSNIDRVLVGLDIRPDSCTPISEQPEESPDPQAVARNRRVARG